MITELDVETGWGVGDSGVDMTNGLVYRLLEEYEAPLLT